MSSTSPVIVIGMHRSGTTMVTRMLERLGLNVGWRKDANWESSLFQGLNEWLLGQCGGAWDHPAPFRELLAADETRDSIVDYLRHILGTPWAVSYLGWRGFLPGVSIFEQPRSWGWKDPRNTFTLPIWLDLFPNARVIHIYRHGIDVANSLVRRGRESLSSRRKRYERLKPTYALRQRKGGFVESYRCITLDGALSLWREYFDEAHRHAEQLGERAIEMQYESLLNEPASGLTRLIRFAGMDVSDEAIARVANEARPDRAYAYRSRHELRSFADRVADQLAVCGYSA